MKMAIRELFAMLGFYQHLTASAVWGTPGSGLGI
jgi:hypothetical protein